jgi:hypothetical protein
VSNKDTIIEALTMQLKIEREGNLALVNRIAELEKQEPLKQCSYSKCQATNGCVGACSKGQPDLARVGEVGVWGDKREWVGLATGEAREFYESDLSREELIHKIDEFLQEKNA